MSVCVHASAYISLCVFVYLQAQVKTDTPTPDFLEVLAPERTFAVRRRSVWVCVYVVSVCICVCVCIACVCVCGGKRVCVGSVYMCMCMCTSPGLVGVVGDRVVQQAVGLLTQVHLVDGSSRRRGPRLVRLKPRQDAHPLTV